MNILSWDIKNHSFFYEPLFLYIFKKTVQNHENRKDRENF